MGIANTSVVLLAGVWNSHWHMRLSNKGYVMSVIKLMQNTEQPLQRVRLLKMILIVSSASLSACSKTYVTPNIPPPATDLMHPAPTGSEVIENASKNMARWLEMLQNGQTK